MKPAQDSVRVTLKHILFLTDFSEPSDCALQFACSVAREFGAEVHALHVLVPQVLPYTSPEAMAGIAAGEEAAACQMARVDSQLAGVNHETSLMRGSDVWTTVERAATACSADLIVLGTHGRTGAQKLLLGSVAEQVFRKSRVPVFTVGPLARSGLHGAARFRRVLCATDFSAEAAAAVPLALSVAQENQAKLVLLHVIPTKSEREAPLQPAMSIADAMHQLLSLVPPEAESWCHPEPVVQYGPPAERILAEAQGRHADLIVLGVRSPEKHAGLATHFSRSVAYHVVAHAPCPVLTVRA